MAAPAEILSYALADPKSGPPESEDALSQSRYVAGGLEIRMKVEGKNTRFAGTLPAIASGARVEADVTFTSEIKSGLPTIPYAGVSCVGDPRPRDFLPRYVLAIDTDKSALILRITGPTKSDFTPVARSSSGAISLTGVNHLSADCVNAAPDRVALALTVNGTQVLQAIDVQPGPMLSAMTGAGLEIVSGSQPGFTAVFRNLRGLAMLPNK